jgi:hypothetical protein
VLARQLVEVGDRLCRQFAVAGGPSAESVRRQVRQAQAAFGSPKVIAYLPVLIERQLRLDLATAPQTRHDDHTG